LRLYISLELLFEFGFLFFVCHFYQTNSLTVFPIDRFPIVVDFRRWSFLGLFRVSNRDDSCYVRSAL